MQLCSSYANCYRMYALKISQFSTCPWARCSFTKEHSCRVGSPSCCGLDTTKYKSLAVKGRSVFLSKGIYSRKENCSKKSYWLPEMCCHNICSYAWATIHLCIQFIHFILSRVHRGRSHLVFRERPGYNNLERSPVHHRTHAVRETEKTSRKPMKCQLQKHPRWPSLLRGVSAQHSATTGKYVYWHVCTHCFYVCIIYYILQGFQTRETLIKTTIFGLDKSHFKLYFKVLDGNVEKEQEQNKPQWHFSR